MCDAHDDAPVLPVDAVPGGTEWPGEVLPLEPVDVPAHCTGWKATHAIARTLPAAFIQNSIGTTIRLPAA